MSKKTIPKRRAPVKPAPVEPLAWELAGEILFSMILKHPRARRVATDDIVFMLRLVIDRQDQVTRKQRSHLEEIAAIIRGHA